MTKRQRSTRRRQRAKARINSAIDHAMRFGVGDAHIGMLMQHKHNGPPHDNAQIMTYARLAGLDEVLVLHGGDLIHHVKKPK